LVPLLQKTQNESVEIEKLARDLRKKLSVAGCVEISAEYGEVLSF
jgi:hypothetical protein